SIESKKQGAVAALSDRSEVAILAALAPVHTDDVSAHVSQQHGAVGTGNETPEVYDPNSRQRLCVRHRVILMQARLAKSPEFRCSRSFVAKQEFYFPALPDSLR